MNCPMEFVPGHKETGPEREDPIELPPLLVPGKKEQPARMRPIEEMVMEILEAGAWDEVIAKERQAVGAEQTAYWASQALLFPIVQEIARGITVPSPTEPGTPEVPVHLTDFTPDPEPVKVVRPGGEPVPKRAPVRNPTRVVKPYQVRVPAAAGVRMPVRLKTRLPVQTPVPSTVLQLAVRQAGQLVPRRGGLSRATAGAMMVDPRVRQTRGDVRLAMQEEATAEAFQKSFLQRHALPLSVAAGATAGAALFYATRGKGPPGSSGRQRTGAGFGTRAPARAAAGGGFFFNQAEAMNRIVTGG